MNFEVVLEDTGEIIDTRLNEPSLPIKGSIIAFLGKHPPYTVTRVEGGSKHVVDTLVNARVWVRRRA